MTELFGLISMSKALMLANCFMILGYNHNRDVLWMGRRPSSLYELLPAESQNSTKNHDMSDKYYIDFSNFWRKTRANYTACETPSRRPDFKSRGSGGSKYWDMGDHVIRHSNHWTGQHGVGRIVDCEWSINIEYTKRSFVTGMCHYQDFVRGGKNSKSMPGTKAKTKDRKH
jgi:hypothetical protein